MKPLISFIAFLIVVAPVAAEEAAENEQQSADRAHAVVREASDELVRVIDEGKSYFEKDPDRFYRAVFEVLDPVVDFEGIARSVMARHYKRASEAQRREFTENFKWGLVRTYGKALLDFGNEEIVVLPPDRPPRNPERRSVAMEVRTEDGEVYPVIYSMVDTDQGWKMRNIIINGVNMGITYRNQFDAAMNRNQRNIDAVVDGWADTVADVDPVAGEEES